MALTTQQLMPSALTKPGLTPEQQQAIMYSALANPGFSYAPLFSSNALQQMAGLQAQPPQQQAAPVTQQPMTTESIQPQLNRLTQQANNALYGGLLGYNQNMPMMSGGSQPQTFAAPQGDFRSAMTGMQGLLGQGSQPNWRGGY